MAVRNLLCVRFVLEVNLLTLLEDIFIVLTAALLCKWIQSKIDERIRLCF